MIATAPLDHRALESNAAKAFAHIPLYQGKLTLVAEPAGARRGPIALTAARPWPAVSKTFIVH